MAKGRKAPKDRRARKAQDDLEGQERDDTQRTVTRDFSQRTVTSNVEESTYVDESSGRQNRYKIRGFCCNPFVIGAIVLLILVGGIVAIVLATQKSSDPTTAPSPQASSLTSPTAGASPASPTSPTSPISTPSQTPPTFPSAPSSPTGSSPTNDDEDWPTQAPTTLAPTACFPGGWTQIGSDIKGQGMSDKFGSSVSLSDNGYVLAIGAPNNDVNGKNSGLTQVYRIQGSDWSKVGIDLLGEAAGDQSGSAVSLSQDGSILAIGANFNNGLGNNSGHTRIYKMNGSSWTQLGRDLDGVASGEGSGTALSLSADGSMLAVGSWAYNGVNGLASGTVRVYRRIGNTWAQLGSNIDGEAADDQSGIALSFSSDGSTLAVGAKYNDGAAGINTGHARVFRMSGNHWVQIGSDIDGEAACDWAGNSLSLSADGSIMAVAAYGNDSNGYRAGHTRVFKFNGSSWIQVGATIDGESAEDWSGSSVSLSADGTKIAIGSRRNSRKGVWAGHTRVFQLEANNWKQVGTAIEGDAGEALSGSSVSLSADGFRLAIGAEQDYEIGAGYVRVYQFDSNANSSC